MKSLVRRTNVKSTVDEHSNQIDFVLVRCEASKICIKSSKCENLFPGKIYNKAAFPGIIINLNIYSIKLRPQEIDALATKRHITTYFACFDLFIFSVFRLIRSCFFISHFSTCFSSLF